MTADEMRERKRKLEVQIAVLLSDFTNETGLLVDNVDVDANVLWPYGKPGVHVKYGRVEVTAKLP